MEGPKRSKLKVIVEANEESLLRHAFFLTQDTLVRNLPDNVEITVIKRKTEENEKRE